VTSGWTGRIRHSGVALIAAVGLLGAAYIGFGLSTHLTVALVILGLIGAVDTVSEILRRALLQYHTPEALQGRVNSLWLAQANAGYSIGGVAAGLAARVVGPAGAVVAAGALCTAGVVALAAALPELRRAGLHGRSERTAPAPRETSDTDAAEATTTP
jgi:ENTS family enterobactin (siderophore) exporter